jgi:hypothetical protein
VSDPQSQLLSSETSKKKITTRDKRIADLETKISKKDVEQTNTNNKIEILEEKQILQLEFDEVKQKKKLLDTLEKSIAEKKGEKERLLTEIAKLSDLTNAATIPEASLSGIYLSIYPIPSYHMLCYHLTYPIQSYLLFYIYLTHYIVILIFFSLVYETFRQLLGKSFDATAMRNEEILQPSNIPQLPRQGLDDIIGNIWTKISSQFRPNPQFALADIRKPLLYVHSSPGCGKVCTMYANYLYAFKVL